MAAPSLPLEGAPVRLGDLVAGRYRLERLLGRGGMGIVIAGRNVVSGEQVAIKFLLAEQVDQPEAIGRFLRECRAAAEIRHDHVARVHEAGALESGEPFLVLEYLEGEDLGTLLRARGPLPPREAIEYVLQASRGLATAHAKGIIHRDLKPSNLFRVRREHAAPTVKVIDFGMSRRLFASGEELTLATALTASAVILGTPHYMSPEQMRSARDADIRADIWSLGAVLYRLITGEYPFPGNTLLEVYDRCLAGPPRLSHIAGAPPALEGIIARCLRRDPEERFQTMPELSTALEQMEDPDASSRTTVVAASTVLPEPLTEQPREASWMGAKPLERPAELTVCPVLVGRQNELAQLERLAKETRGGAVRVGLISGPMGVGRTRLLDAAMSASGFPRDCTLRVSCAPERRGPLRPLRHALSGSALASALEAAINHALAPAALPSADQEDDALLAVEAALVQASLASPLLLAVDDLQWADLHTLGLLRLLIERAGSDGPGRILLLAALRDEPSPSPALKALLNQARRAPRSAVKHVALAPLHHADAVRLADAVGPVAKELAEAVAASSGGVPFFIVHALHAFREVGAIELRGGSFVAVDDRATRGETALVPDLLEARLSTYFDPGGAAERKALQVLAVVALHGGGLSFPILSATSGEEHLEEVLSVLTASGILTVSAMLHEYSFGQEMVRQAALRLAANKPWYPRVFRSLLDALAKQPGARADAAYLAAGYERLGLASDAGVWLERAMQDAIARGGFEEAAALGDRLSALLVEPAARAAVELDIVRALLRGRRVDDAHGRLLALHASGLVTGSGTRPIDLRFRIYRLFVARAQRDSHVLDAALLADADASPHLGLRAEARMALAGITRGEAALMVAGEAIKLAAEHGPALEFEARVLRAELCYEAEKLHLALASDDLRRALEIAKATGTTWQQIHIEGDLAVLEAELGRLGPAIDRLYRLAQDAERHGMRGQLRVLLLNLAAFLMRAARSPEAAEVAGKAARLAGMAGDSVVQAMALSLRAHALLEMADAHAALVCANEAEALQAEREDGLRALTLLRRAKILSSLDRGDEALVDARRARRLAETRGDRDLATGAMLWETLHLAQRGEASKETVQQAIREAENAEITFRELTRTLFEQAQAWLANQQTA